MSDSRKKKYKLNIQPITSYDEWINVSILDGNNELITEQTGTFSVDLPKGLYTVMTESGGHTSQQVVRHMAENSLEIKSPVKSGYLDRQRNFLIKVSEQSNKFTYNNPSVLDNHSSIFIFLYYLDTLPESFDLNIYEKFSLLDKNQSLVLSLSELTWETNSEGWMSFQCRIDPGTYYLHCNEINNRAFPVEIIPDAQTMISLSFKNGPIFPTYSMAISKNVFDPMGESFHSYETALQKLHNRDFNVSKKIIRDLAYGKWGNPFYGIVVAYLYLKSESHSFDKLMDTVIKNLETRILHDNLVTDLRVIKLIRDIRGKDNNEILNRLENEPPYNEPPVLRIGMETLIDISYDFPGIIEENSVLEMISDRLYYDTPWTSYKSVKLDQKRNKLVDTVIQQFVGKKMLIELEEFAPAVIDILEREKLIEITSKDLSMQLRIPPAHLNRRLNQLSDFMDRNEDKIHVIQAVLKTQFNLNLDVSKFRKQISRLTGDQDSRTIPG